MSSKTNAVMLALVGIEVLVFLIPTTLVYLAGLGWALIPIFAKVREPATQSTLPISIDFLRVVGILIVLGYALLSLWWLVVIFRKITIQKIPRFIWLGVCLGVLAAIVSLIACLNEFGIPKISMHTLDMLEVASLLGGGPLILVVTVLSAMHFRVGLHP